MKTTIHTFLIAAIAASIQSLSAFADTEVVDGIEWYYTVADGTASISRRGMRIGGGPTIPSSTSGNITIPSMLGGCSVTSVGVNAFSGCSGLTSVIIPDSVTSIGNCAFSYCSSLTSVTIPNSVTNIGEGAFGECSNLSSVTIGSGVMSIGEEAFYGCGGLMLVTFSCPVPFIASSAFENCSDLMSIVVENNDPNYSLVNGLLLSKDGNVLIRGVNGDVTIPDSVTTIGNGAFTVFPGLTSVSIPNSVTNIGDKAFFGCSGLTSVIIPDSVTSIGDSAFMNCSGLTSIEVPLSVASIGKDAFKGCGSVNWRDAPEGVPSGPTGSGNIVFPEQIVYHAGWPGLVQTRNGDAASPRRELGAVMGFVGSSANGGSYTSPIDGVTTTWAERDSWLYEGEMYMVSGTSYTFGTYVDDHATIDIDDNQILNQPQCRFTTATYQCSQTGWHKISVKVWDTGGGYGNTYGWLGVAYNTVGATSQSSSAWEQLADPGDRSLLRTTTKALSMSGVHVIAQIRESDPTVMDVDYVVYADPDTTPTVNVRALAFEDGARSFASVIRPETFIEGTDANIGDGITANVEHHLAWKVSSDWAIDLAKVKFEVMVMKPGDLLLPDMHFVTIPAAEGHPKTTVSVNSVSFSDLYNTLLWCYADSDPALSLSSGTLMAGGRDLVRNTPSNKANALRYIGEKHGYRLLDNSAELAWINECTRLNLPLNERLVKTMEE